jgi:hypothetical protein
MSSAAAEYAGPLKAMQIFLGVFFSSYFSVTAYVIFRYWSLRHLYPIKQRGPVLSILIEIIANLYFFLLTEPGLFGTWDKMPCPLYVVPNTIALIAFFTLTAVRGLLLLIQVLLTKASLEYGSEIAPGEYFKRLCRFLLKNRKWFTGIRFAGFVFLVVLIQSLSMIITAVQNADTWMYTVVDIECDRKLTDRIVGVQLIFTFFYIITIAALCWALWKTKENLLLVMEFKYLVGTLVFGFVTTAVGKVIPEVFYSAKYGIFGSWVISSCAIIVTISIWNITSKTLNLNKKTRDTTEGTSNFEDRPSKSEINQDGFDPRKPSDVLQKYLSESRQNYEIFKQFMCQEFAVENLLFLETAQAISKLSEPQTQEEKGLVQFKIEECYERFIVETSPMMVNISHECRGKIIEHVKDGSGLSDVKIFDDAMKEIMRLISLDSFQRFKNTPEFKKWIGVTLQTFNVQAVSVVEMKEL